MSNFKLEIKIIFNYTLIHYYLYSNLYLSFMYIILFNLELSGANFQLIFTFEEGTLKVPMLTPKNSFILGN